MKVIAVIPARYDSTRFCGKVLAKETGKYLVQHTYEQALCAKSVEQVFIATDSELVADACKEFGAPCVMTSDKHRSGTDRIAEAVADIDTDIIINVQGDEPEIDPNSIDILANLLMENPEVPMATLVTKISDESQLADSNVVKVVLDNNSRAIYFSRSPMPFNRDKGKADVELAYRHLGIYAYRKDFILEITSQPQTPLEKAESLEQLRAIENGYPILAGKVSHHCEGIDTAEQYAAFVKRYSESK